MSVYKKFYVFKSKTIRCFGVVLPVVSVVAEVTREHLPLLQEYIPDGLYKGVLIACVVGIWLRASTSRALSEYKQLPKD